MKGRLFVGITTATLAALGVQQTALAQTVTPCAPAANCVQVQVTAGAVSGDQVPVTVNFRQGPSNGQAGGPDEIAALALTLSIGSLHLADCTRGADGLPGAVVPDAAIPNFKVVVENGYCDGGRAHCLCPDTGSSITPDTFINLVVYGPNPLPPPGPTPVDIPTLPAGPANLVSINLSTTGASGTIPLRVFTETKDTQRPQFTAFLSVGDKLAVDQTCVPVQGQPPCSAGATSQVVITDGQVVLGPACVGNCNGDSEVTIDDLLQMVSIALGGTGSCPAGDPDGSGEITIDEILQAVNNALTGCPA